MNTLSLYYSYIKHPYGNTFIKKEDSKNMIFLLNVHNCIQAQIVTCVVLFFFISRYYFIIDTYVSKMKYVYKETNARSPPIKEVQQWLF